MTPQSNYEKARDEAAEKNASNLYDAQGDIQQQMPWSDCKDSFIKGADFGRSYEQKLNADLLADNKLMREALKFYSLKSNYSLVDKGRNYDVDYKCYELNETTYADVELGTKARQVLSQLKGKYDE